MIRCQAVSGVKSVVSPAKLRPARSSTIVSAVPLLADIPTITCTTSKGTVSCVDELGEAVKGSRLKELQSILKPIADAPTLADAKQASAKDVSVKAPEGAKTADAKPVSDTPAPPKEHEVKAQPAVATPEAKLAVSEPKVEGKVEAKPSVVADTKPAAPPAAKPAVSDATIPEAKPAVKEEAKPAEPMASVVTQSKPAPQTPPPAQTISGDAKPPTPTPPKPAAPAVETPKPPAPTQAASSGTPAPQTTPSTPDAAGPPPSSKPSEPATNVSTATPSPPSNNLALKSPKGSGPVTLASPDLAPLPSGNELRPRSVSRGNDDSVSFSTGTTAKAEKSGNSTLGLDEPVSSANTPLRPTTVAGRFPGNVDPANFLPDEFDDVVTNVTPLKSAAMTSATKAKTISVINEKGLIPGNLPPELGDILQLVNAVNTTPAKNLDLRVYPGNIPPEGAIAQPTVLEFTPGDSAAKGKDVQAVKMELTPGNVTPELADMLDFFGIGPGSGA